MNHLSDYGSVETNLAISDEKFSQEFESLLLNIINKDCRQVTFLQSIVVGKLLCFNLPIGYHTR